jgi:hypothetical protein
MVDIESVVYIWKDVKQCRSKIDTHGHTLFPVVVIRLVLVVLKRLGVRHDSVKPLCRCLLFNLLMSWCVALGALGALGQKTRPVGRSPRRPMLVTGTQPTHRHLDPKNKQSINNVCVFCVL